MAWLNRVVYRFVFKNHSQCPCTIYSVLICGVLISNSKFVDIIHFAVNNIFCGLRLYNPPPTVSATASHQLTCWFQLLFHLYSGVNILYNTWTGPKWHSVPYVVHYFIGNRVPFEKHNTNTMNYSQQLQQQLIIITAMTSKWLDN